MRLSKSQIKQMSSFISLNLKDIRDFIDQNRDDFEKWLKEEENSLIKHKQIYTRYIILKAIDNSFKMKEIVNIKKYVIWNCYPY